MNKMQTTTRGGGKHSYEGLQRDFAHSVHVTALSWEPLLSPASRRGGSPSHADRRMRIWAAAGTPALLLPQGCWSEGSVHTLTGLGNARGTLGCVTMYGSHHRLAGMVRGTGTHLMLGVVWPSTRHHMKMLWGHPWGSNCSSTQPAHNSSLHCPLFIFLIFRKIPGSKVGVKLILEAIPMLISQELYLNLLPFSCPHRLKPAVCQGC